MCRSNFIPEANGANIIKVSEYHAHKGQRPQPNIGQRMVSHAATLDTSIHSGRYFADLVGIQGTVCADNAASTLAQLSVWKETAMGTRLFQIPS